MATKAEMQAAYELCEQIHNGAAAGLSRFEFSTAVKHAETALPHQHAAVSVQRRFLAAAAPTTPAVDLILRYAPAFFLTLSLDALETWYLGGTKTERTAMPDIPKRIADSRKTLSFAVELWGALAESPTAMLQSDPRNKSLLSVWRSAALVAVSSHDPIAHFRVTDPRREAVAKCSSCGQERRAPLADFLEPSRCPACGRRSDFVLIRRVLK